MTVTSYSLQMLVSETIKISLVVTDMLVPKMLEPFFLSAIPSMQAALMLTALGLECLISRPCCDSVCSLIYVHSRLSIVCCDVY